MFQTVIQIEESQRLTLVEFGSNLTLIGWDREDVQIRLRDGQSGDLTIEQDETGPSVSARVACEIRVPDNLPVKIRQARSNVQVKKLVDLDAEQVRGNLRLTALDKAVVAEVYGNLRATEISSLRLVGTVFGDASLKSVRHADLQNVRGNLNGKDLQTLRASRIGGNLNAKDVGDSLKVDQVGGNAVLKGVGGAVGMEQVAGNLVAKNLMGGAGVPKIGGNLVLNGQIAESNTYHFSTRGNATLRLPQDAGAHLTLMAKGKTYSSLPLTSQEQTDGKLVGTLGNGGTEIAIEAKGNILLGEGGPVIGTELGEEISRQVEESLQTIDLEAIGRQVSDEMESAMSRLQVKLESVDWERIGLQTQESVERAMEQMRRNMDRVVEKAARQQEKLERKLEREEQRKARAERRRQSEREVEAPEMVDEQAGEPVASMPDLEEERLSILKMVEQGQISPGEAEMLLDALE
jgi:hypothetical protein